MLESKLLVEAKPLYFTVTQMYDYLKLGFNLGSPHDMSFEVTLSEEDIDGLVEKLIRGKEKLKLARERE